MPGQTYNPNSQALEGYNGVTEIVVVLDRSGSMGSCRSDVIGGMNRLIQDQKKVQADVYLTMVQFDHEYEFVHRGLPVGQVPELTEESYIPRGNTALLDAIGRAVSETAERIGKMDEGARPGRVVVVVYTDGQENASSEWTKLRVKDLVESQQKKGWQFMFLAANLDAFADASGMGMPMASSSPSPGGVARGMSVVSPKLVAYSGGGSASCVDFTQEELDVLAVPDQFHDMKKAQVDANRKAIFAFPDKDKDDDKNKKS